jgi:hypothetical protein
VADVFNNPTDPQPPPALETGSKPAFLKSPAGIALAVVAVLLVLGAAVVAALLYMQNGGFGGSKAPTVNTVVTGSTKPGSTATSATLELPIVEPQEKPLESTFTFRNIFAPTVKKPQPVVLLSSNGATSSVDVPKDTLYLQSIDEQNGVRMATFIWNDATYTLAEGESIPGTPWKVLDIREDSVVMLFGDTEVTLTVGQGLSK